jgi:hypothetical protein
MQIVTYEIGCKRESTIAKFLFVSFGHSKKDEKAKEEVG